MEERDRPGLRGRVAAVAVAGTTALAGLALLVAPAAQSRVDPEPERDQFERRAATKIARAIAVNPRHVRSARFSLLPPGGFPAAIGSGERLAGFPRQGSRFGILSNGDATAADNANDQEDLGTALAGPLLRGARDVVILRIDLRVPRNARCLSFRFKFLSEEFPEFAESEFNDAFIAELERSNWRAGTFDDPTIQAPRNFATDSEGRPIRVNSVGELSVTRRAARGTTYDAGTRVLRAATPIRPGRRTLYLSIFDQGDRDYDSTVFIDQLELDRTSPCEPGVVFG